MLEIKDFLKSHNIKPIRYERSGKTTIINTEDEKIVLKKTKTNEEIFNILETRNFNYYPKIIAKDDEYELTEYIEETKIPFETKMQDMINLVSLLHNKTTFYKETDDYKITTIYEDVNNNIVHLDGYYSDLMTIIESKVYMSPSEYTLAKNISLVYYSLYKSKEYIEKWYKLIKEEKKERNVVLHNNLSVDHFIKNKNSYLINWGKSKLDIPIFDMYKLYNRHYRDISYEEIITQYEKNYPLLESEKNLLNALLIMPDKVEFTNNLYNDTQKVTNMIDKIKNVNDYLTK